MSAAATLDVVRGIVERASARQDPEESGLLAELLTALGGHAPELPVRDHGIERVTVFDGLGRPVRTNVISAPRVVTMPSGHYAPLPGERFVGQPCGDELTGWSQEEGEAPLYGYELPTKMPAPRPIYGSCGHRLESVDIRREPCLHARTIRGDVWLDWRCVACGAVVDQ